MFNCLTSCCRAILAVSPDLEAGILHIFLFPQNSSSAADLCRPPGVNCPLATNYHPEVSATRTSAASKAKLYCQRALYPRAHKCTTSISQSSIICNLICWSTKDATIFVCEYWDGPKKQKLNLLLLRLPFLLLVQKTVDRLLQFTL